MRRALIKLTTEFVAYKSNSRGLLVNMPMLAKTCFSEPHGISSMRSISTASQSLSLPGKPSKVFVSHHVYKGNTAMSMQPIAPKFSPLDSGAIRGSEQGAILLTFAPSVGPKHYDWSRKQVFCLSVTEIGSLLSLNPSESCKFFHDPFKGKSNAGKISKVLQVMPMPNNAGYFFNLNVSNAMDSIDARFVIPITVAEFEVMRTIFNFTLPYIMGWHAFTNSIGLYRSGKTEQVLPDMQGSSGPEWEK